VPEPETPAVEDEPVHKEESIIKAEGPKSWGAFLKQLFGVHRSLALNLERARLVSEVDENSTEIRLAFTEEDKFFYDVLNEPENIKQLNVEVSRYFSGREQHGPKVSYSFIDQETKERENLYSTVELEEKKIQDDKDVREAKIRDNKFIKEAQELFSGKLSKIILNKDE
ncbi:MAG: hypothetical protein KC478_12765, partial [Bacteriovoracaceae bacterium]|nr:hypothetical protein [Bacteriovoracaceae bacterium]